MTARHDNKEFLRLPHAEGFQDSEVGLGTCRLRGQKGVQLSTQGKSFMTVYICSSQRRINKTMNRWEASVHSKDYCLTGSARQRQRPAVSHDTADAFSHALVLP